MIYHLFHILKSVGVDFPGIGLLEFYSSRAIAAAVTALLVSIFAGKAIIRQLQKHQIGEEIRDLGLEGQLQKKGTPTMGGVIIIVSILSGILLFSDLTNIYNDLLILTTLWFGGLGFIDDYIKVFKHKKSGMSEHGKLIGQFALGLAIAVAVCFDNQIGIQTTTDIDQTTVQTEQTIETVPQKHTKSGAALKLEERSTKTTIPFVKNHEFDYAWLNPFGHMPGGRWVIYVIMIVIVIMACSNGTNLTDGMDGLAAGTTALVGVVLGVFAWLSDNLGNADYLGIMNIPGAGEVAVFMSAFVGALVGFLWYNSYPAQVFMGDTGSLTIGGIIGVGAVLIRKELLLPLLGGIFLVEALSVLMQRVYFKYTKRRYGEGRRIFRMTPLHHHYQKEGIPALITTPKKALPEAKIVARFWIIGIILAVLTLALLKVR